MNDKVYVKGQWHRDISRMGYFYQPAGYYELGLIDDRSEWLFVDDDQARDFIPILEGDGFIKPRLDERLRTEDLKITHRLLDLLEKK